MFIFGMILPVQYFDIQLEKMCENCLKKKLNIL